MVSNDMYFVLPEVVPLLTVLCSVFYSDFISLCHFGWVSIAMFSGSLVLLSGVHNLPLIPIHEVFHFSVVSFESFISIVFSLSFRFLEYMGYSDIYCFSVLACKFCSLCVFLDHFN